jgi:ATP-dependent DNA helicase RecQ
VFEQLRAWRGATAKEQGVPAYVIFHDATLREIASRMPADLGALGSISGIGENKLAKYGEGVLGVLAGAPPEAATTAAPNAAAPAAEAPTTAAPKAAAPAAEVPRAAAAKAAASKAAAPKAAGPAAVASWAVAPADDLDDPGFPEEPDYPEDPGYPDHYEG